MTHLQPNGYTFGQEEIQETTGIIHTSQGLILTGDKAKEFRKIALEVVEGNNEVIKILDEIERKREEETKITNNKLSLDQICDEIEKELASIVGGAIFEVINAIKASGYIDEKNDQGCNALFYAIREGKLDIIEILIENGANLENTYAIFGEETSNPVYFLSKIDEKGLKSLNYLINLNKIDLEKNNLNRENLLIYLIQKLVKQINIDKIEYSKSVLLIEKIIYKMQKIYINQKNIYGNSAMTYAYILRNAYIMAKLKEAGGKITIRDIAIGIGNNINKLFTNQ